jgi:HSP20 family molecular chaperone IbpA
MNLGVVMDDNAKQKLEDAQQNVADAAKLAAEDAKAALAPLKGLMTGKPAADALINRNPVLAFVTGHLEKLDPESLPALITDSALIKQAMSANDVAQFMQTPMTIGDLVSLLELDQSLVNKASQAGLDPNKLVTPKEFLQALGLDAGRVASELSILKQKLPSEGVASYVQRAKAMMANAAKVVGQSPVANTASKLNKDASNEIATGKKSAGDAKERMTSELGSPALANIAVPSSDAGVNAQAANLAGIVQANAANLASSNDSLVQQNVGLAGSMSAMSKTVLSQTSKQPLANESVDPADLLAAQAIYSGVKIASTSDNLKSDNIATTSAILDASKLEITEDVPAFDLKSVEQISSNEIAKDPYSELGRLMDTNSMTKVDFGGDGMSQRSLEEHLLSRGIQQALQQKTDPTGEGKGLDLRLKDEPGEILNIDMLQDVKPNMLADTQVVITPSKESSMTGFDFSQGEGFQDGSAAFREQTTEFATSLGKQTTEIRQTSDLFADKISEAPKGTTKESLASKILGHAQMMLKNGGGSMRLDVEAPGIGKVDVAINLNNNQLDVRIITASEQARDMISKEVLGLRDGLTQQGINLRGLEVGKAGESSPRNFAGQGQQFGQGAQDQRASYNDMREYAQSFKNNFAPRADRAMTQVASTLSRWSNASIPSNGNGRLEVRV